MEELISKAFEECHKENVKCDNCPFYIYATDKSTCIIIGATFGIKGVKIEK